MPADTVSTQEQFKQAKSLDKKAPITDVLYFQSFGLAFFDKCSENFSKRENDLSELWKSQGEDREDRKDRKVAVLHGKCKDIAKLVACRWFVLEQIGS